MFPCFIFGCWSRVLVFTASLVVLPEEGAGLGGVCIVGVGVRGACWGGRELTQFLRSYLFYSWLLECIGNFDWRLGGVWVFPDPGGGQFRHARVEIWQRRFWFKSAGKLTTQFRSGLGCWSGFSSISSTVAGGGVSRPYSYRGRGETGAGAAEVELNGAVWVCRGYALGGVVGESYG
ncbi:uncharacterized protein EI90DRAFT_3253109 [Cantharellus anzutake]|uniref:uncharacterized protein n=1 Tax=Cantharellus anzutake TaxID=1750568 RepID=UPI0019052380|nr:uncharacterized protein EI90DRAFT_3253109 [Cantharellus anzutake]KAF8321014.1 hypothetical protein EI90DRAFT_3253109 [Cantharellus anzutake]